MTSVCSRYETAAIYNLWKLYGEKSNIRIVTYICIKIGKLFAVDLNASRAAKAVIGGNTNYYSFFVHQWKVYDWYIPEVYGMHL